MKSLIKFYTAVFFRRLHFFLAIFIVFAVASFTLARILPPVYQSEARLLVESAQIPKELAASTVVTVASEQLQIIEQRLLTRANLLDISTRLNVFEDLNSMTADAIVKKMRKHTLIERQSGYNQATLMTVAFEANTGQIAASVTNEFVTRILQDNADIRTSRAGDTMDFFDQEVDRLGTELQFHSAKILNYKSENSDALPETLEYRLNQQTRLLERLASLEREISALRSQKTRLAQIFEATGRLGTIPTDTRTPEQIQLARLQDELATAKAIYSASNPKITLLEAQVAQLEARNLGRPAPSVADNAPQASILDVQLADIDARIETLGQQSTQLSEELAVLDETISRTTGVKIALDALERDSDNIQAQYNTAVDRLAKAATGERIELLSKGQRITILEAAVVPNKPAKPNRKLIAVGGSLVGAGLGVAFIVLLELLNQAIRRPLDITNSLGITPITTIPYIRTPMELVMRRAIFTSLLALVIFGLPAMLYAIHVYYLPLDLIYDRVAGKIEGFL